MVCPWAEWRGSQLPVRASKERENWSRRQDGSLTHIYLPEAHSYQLVLNISNKHCKHICVVQVFLLKSLKHTAQSALDYTTEWREHCQHRSLILWDSCMRFEMPRTDASVRCFCFVFLGSECRHPRALFAAWTVTLMVHDEADVCLIKARHHGTAGREVRRLGSPATIPVINTLMLAHKEPAQNSPRVR